MSDVKGLSDASSLPALLTAAHCPLLGLFYILSAPLLSRHPLALASSRAFLGVFNAIGFHLHTMASLGLHAQTPPATSLALAAFWNCRRRFHATFMYMSWTNLERIWLILPNPFAGWGQEQNPFLDLHLICWWLLSYKINWVQAHPQGTNSYIVFWIQPFFKLQISWSTRLGTSITLPGVLFPQTVHFVFLLPSLFLFILLSFKTVTNGWCVYLTWKWTWPPSSPYHPSVLTCYRGWLA